MGARKVRTVDPTNVPDKCKEITTYECSEPAWTTHSDRDEVTPPVGTVAIVVDLRENWGAVRIYKAQNDDYVDMVGMEEKKNLVIVLWQNDWVYLCTGSPRVGFVKKK